MCVLLVQFLSLDLTILFYCCLVHVSVFNFGSEFYGILLITLGVECCKFLLMLESTLCWLSQNTRKNEENQYLLYLVASSEEMPYKTCELEEINLGCSIYKIEYIWCCIYLSFL